MGAGLAIEEIGAMGREVESRRGVGWVVALKNYGGKRYMCMYTYMYVDRYS
jgi:hypothetical protein